MKWLDQSGNGIHSPEKITDIEELIGDSWIGGVFEVRLRRLPSSKKGKNDD